ncbi:AAA domain-containing protein [Streptomyces sp. NPDC002122]|uniref:AAA domain-containing protein n=1 Tax=Streptomyces sp. NPDC002122 TaxID=3154407 RepID=UPI00331F3264
MNSGTASRHAVHDAVGIVRYWRAIELFSPPTLPRPPRTGARVTAREWIQQLDVRPGQEWPLLPWEAGHPLQREPIDTSKEVWRHTVYGGVFALSAIREALERAFGGGEEDYAGTRQRGETAVFSLTLDDQGVLLNGATTFSSCAWATGRIRDPGPDTTDWLDGFEDVEAACDQAIALLTSQDIPYRTESPASATSPGGSPGGVPSPRGEGSLLPPLSPRRDWQAIIREILGGAAVGALGVFIGDLGAGIVAGALRPVGRRVAARLRGETSTVVPPQAAAPVTPVIRTPSAEVDLAAEAPADGATEQAESAGRPVQLPDLVAFAAHVADLCGIADLLSPHSIRIHSKRVRRRKDGSLPDAEPAFLNSHLPQDLQRVVDAADPHATGGYGRGLAAYLADSRTVPRGVRVDVRSAPHTVLEKVAPDDIPLGRWPAPSKHPLALSQQFAVNRAMAELGPGTGLFSVNGPPGTGKTTMLRDLIAAIVVERATALAALDTPGQAFRDQVTWQDEGRTRSVRKPRPELTGHEIVVASSNNGAVQNITTELPSLGAIGDEWAGEASYFLDLAVALLDGAPAWGAVAAPLGNAEKRKEFMDRYWWGDKPESPDAQGRGAAPTGNRGRGPARNRSTDKVRIPGLQYVLQGLERNPDHVDPPARERFPSGGPGRLTPVSEGTAPVADWAGAKAAFQAATRVAEDLRAQRVAVWSALRSLDGLVLAVQAAEEAEESAREHQDELQRLEREARSAVEAAEAEARIAESLWEAHAATPRPGGWPGRRREASRRDWQAAEDGLASRRRLAREAVGRRRVDLTIATTALGRAEDALWPARAETIRAADALLDARQTLAGARAEWPDHVPFDWDTLTDAEREKYAPWSDPDFCAARTRVFLAALDLHRAFVVSQAGTIRANLRHLKEAFAGVLPEEPTSVVWQTLFLVLPVVSTTFASCGRLFQRLGRESLGWLLVDEAGQAAPQAAVGALWRARRTVMVGDPLQLEPVVPLPLSVQQRLRSAFGVAEEWMPSLTSAQRVADRTNRWGTTVEYRQADGETEAVWVGSPLRVHRRCEETIFDLSNRIAYGGLMVYGTKERPFPGPEWCEACRLSGQEGCGTCVYPLSCWVDVNSTEAQGKWIPEEGHALAQMLRKLHQDWAIGLDRVRILSPFRDVVVGCEQTVRDMDLGGLVPQGMDPAVHRKQVSHFLDENIGTVHTMQGKEADVVFLVLGTHPRHGVGARRWAAETPHLLNVAVSRAKRRLFVIGNHEQWGKEPHFDTPADPAWLPRRAWPGGNGRGRP